MTRKTKLLIRDAFLSSILSSILIIIVTAIFLSLDFLNPLHKALEDFNFLDIYYSENFNSTSKINQDIILVNVENRSRLEIAKMIDYVAKENPKVIGIDIIFDELKESYMDSILRKSMDLDNLVSSLDYKNGLIKENNSYFDTNENLGYINFNFDTTETVVRDFVGITQIAGQKQLSFASQIAKEYLEDQWYDLDYDYKLNKIQTINFSGNINHFLRLDYEDFLEYENKEIIKDKIVIFGYLGLSQCEDRNPVDRFFTPLNEYPAGKSDADMFGVVIHANIVSMLIENDFFYRIPKLGIYFITFIVIFLTSIFYIRNNKKYKVSGRTRKVIFQTLLAVLIILITLWLFELGVILWPFPILVGMFLAGSYFKYYKHLVRFVKTKRKWKTYIK